MGSFTLLFALALIPGIVLCGPLSKTEKESLNDIINLLLSKRDGKAELSVGSQEVRKDGRCGVGYPSLAGKPAKCKADDKGKRPCCNLLGQCRNKAEDCNCEGCVDYTLEKSIDDRELGTLTHEKRGVLVALAIGAAVVVGATLAGVTLATLIANLRNRAVAIEVDNWTRFPLTKAWAHGDRGQIKTPPTTIKPGYKEAMTAQKSWGFYGTRGVVTWRIGDSGSYITVMWSVPYNRIFNHNYLAIGITRKIPKSNGLFNQMWNGAGDFKRQKYDADKGIPTIQFVNSDMRIEGIMGTTGKAEVKIILKPTYSVDLAPALKKKLNAYCSARYLSIGEDLDCSYGA